LPALTPVEFKAARERCGLNQADWALALGYASPDRKNLRQQVNDMEGGRKAITPQVARLAEMFRRHGVPREWLTLGG
jgi:DNA-binding transcriptional regulator YiaG